MLTFKYGIRSQNTNVADEFVRIRKDPFFTDNSKRLGATSSFSNTLGLRVPSKWRQMDSRSERDKFGAIASQADDHRTENLLENELNEVAGLLADSPPRRTRVLTEKGLSYWMEARDLRLKNQDRYREIIEGHAERIYDIINTGEGTDLIDELLAKITRSYQDYSRQFDSEEEQMSLSLSPDIQ